MNCCEKHASELRCDYCPWCRIAELEARELGWIQTLSTMEAENKKLQELLDVYRKAAFLREEK